MWIVLKFDKKKYFTLREDLKNKLIGFEGVNLTHSVNQITEGTRYTVPCWYRHANV